MVRRRKDTPEARAFWEGVEATARRVESWPDWKRGMSSRRDFKTQLEDVFGGGGQVAPGGTAAVLTSPSKIDRELVAQVVKQVPLDAICKDIGAVAAREIANALQQYGLRPADFTDQPDLPAMVAKRIVGRLIRSEEFSRSFTKYLSMRG